ILLVGPVIAWAHRPESAVLGIPAHRQLKEPAVRGAMQVAASMVARAKHVIHLCFHLRGHSAAESDLVALLDRISIALDHGVIPIRGAMIKAVAGPVILNDVLRARAIE